MDITTILIFVLLILNIFSISLNMISNKKKTILLNNILDEIKK